MYDNSLDLAPMIEPREVPTWPLQPGWWVLIGLLVMILLLFVWQRIKIYRSNAYRRAAVKELDQLNVVKHTAHSFASVLNLVLKRTALQSFPRSKVAALSEQQWLDFLSDTAPNTDISHLEELMASSLYSEADEVIENRRFVRCLNQAKRWILNHQAYPKDQRTG